MRSKKLLICLVFLFVSLFAFGFNVKVNAIETSELIEVKGAQVRTTGNPGLRFVATETYEGEESYGILLAFGEAAADENFVVGGTVNGKEVGNAPVATAEGGVFMVTLWDIPETMYTQKVSARAYVVVGENYVYSSTITVKSLAEVALKAKAEGDDSEIVNGAVAATANYKKTWTDAKGRVFVGSATYESEPLKLGAAFIADWNKKFETELTVSSFTGGTSSEFWTSARTNKQSGSEYPWEGSKLKEFFQDAEMGAKWGWLLDFTLENGKNDFAKQQAQAIKDNVENPTKWYFGAHFISDIMSFLTGETQSSGYGGYNFTTYTSQVLTKFDQYNTTVYADLEGCTLVKLTDTVAVPAIANKDGYTAQYIGAEEAVYAEGDTISAANNFVIEIKYTPIEYTIVCRWEELGLDVNTYQYTIEKAVEFEPISISGYVFEGWYDNPEFTGEPVTGVAKGNFGAKTFYAKMTESAYNEVTVTFESNYKYATWADLTDALLADINEVLGKTYSKAEWFAVGPWTINSAKFNKLVTEAKYVHWRTLAEVVAGIETSANKPAIQNWANGVENSGSANPYAIEYVTRALINSSQYTRNANFKTSDYSDTAIQEAILAAVTGPRISSKYIAPATITETLTRPGYTFVGWYTNPECTGDPVTQFPGYNDDTSAVTYYAKWEVAE